MRRCLRPAHAVVHWCRQPGGRICPHSRVARAFSSASTDIASLVDHVRCVQFMFRVAAGMAVLTSMLCRKGDYEHYLCGKLMPSAARDSFFVMVGMLLC